jgi:hypothetical protein
MQYNRKNRLQESISPALITIFQSKLVILTIPTTMKYYKNCRFIAISTTIPQKNSNKTFDFTAKAC